MEAVSGWRRWAPVAWVAVLSLAIMAPTLAPGFTLSYDMVFTPRQALLPDALGIGGSLPRAVPQDAVVAILELAIPGEWLQKVLLLAIPLLAGLGMLRLLRGAPTSARLIAATLAVWNPYVAERLVIGHWGLLLAYALTPWALARALDMRRGSGGAGVGLVLLIAAGSLTPSGSILVTAIALPVAIGPGSRASVRSRVLTTAGALACWLPWLLPALLSPALGRVDPAGSGVFALRDEGFGSLLTAAGLGGIWNGEVVLPSRAWPTAAVLSVVLLALCAMGVAPLSRLVGRALVAWWVVVSLLGLAAALASALLPQAWGNVLQVVPGGGILRDSHKLLAPLALLVAAGAGAAVGQLVRRIAEPSVRGALVVLVALVPMALLPDLAWGASGRLQAVPYPPAWSQVRDTVAASDRSGDVVVLPWSAFRRFEWNAERTVLDPAPRWLTRTSVVSDSLAVATRDGIVVVAGEDPRAREIERVLADGQPLLSVLPGLGIGWVLVEIGQSPGVPPGALEGLVEVRPGPELSLYAVEGPVSEADVPGYGPWIVAVDVAVAALLLGLAGVAAARGVGGARDRRRRDRGGAGDPLVR